MLLGLPCDNTPTFRSPVPEDCKGPPARSLSKLLSSTPLTPKQELLDTGPELGKRHLSPDIAQTPDHRCMEYIPYIPYGSTYLLRYGGSGSIGIVGHVQNALFINSSSPSPIRPVSRLREFRLQSQRRTTRTARHERRGSTDGVTAAVAGALFGQAKRPRPRRMGGNGQDIEERIVFMIFRFGGWEKSGMEAERRSE